MTDTLKLTPEEQQLVLAHRAKVQRAAGYDTGYRKAIDTASYVLTERARSADGVGDHVMRDHWLAAAQEITNLLDTEPKEDS